MLLLINLQANSNPTLDVALRYAAFALVWLAQIKDDYRNPRWTAAVVLLFCAMPIFKFGLACRLPPYDIERLCKGLCAGFGAAVCLVFGVDDTLDPLRVFHGLSQGLVGLALYYLWQLVVDTAKEFDGFDRGPLLGGGGGGTGMGSPPPKDLPPPLVAAAAARATRTADVDGRPAGGDAHRLLSAPPWLTSSIPLRVFPSCVCDTNNVSLEWAYLLRVALWCTVVSTTYRGRPLGAGRVSRLSCVPICMYRTGGEQVVPGTGAQIAESLCAWCAGAPAAASHRAVSFHSRSPSALFFINRELWWENCRRLPRRT